MTYNDADTVKECVESVVRQDYPSRETIVVCDGGSSDGTEGRLRELQGAGPGRFELVTVPHTGRSAARNAGWMRGKGGVVFFADADDVYELDYLTNAVRAITGDNVGCVCVTGASLAEGSSLAQRMLKLYSILQVKRRAASGFNPSWAWVYTRKALEAAGGFDERLDQAEDRDLFERVRKLGFEVAVVGGVHWFHRRPNTNAKYFKKTLKGGSSRIPYLAKRHDFIGFIRGTGIVWFICLAAAAQAFYPLAVVIFGAVLLAGLLYRGASTASQVWGDVPRKLDLLIYPFFNLASHSVSAVGSLVGLARYVAYPPRRWSGNPPGG